MVEIKRSKKKMRGNVKILIVIFLILVFGKGISQNVIFVEPPNVQRAMESYQKSFEKNEMVDGFRIQYFFTKDRKSTRLNSSHVTISYAVFCLKKKQETRR